MNSTGRTMLNVVTGTPNNISAIATSDVKEIRLIVIGASTGGTEAVLEVVKQLPADFPPIVVAQHMPPGFTNMYAKRLDGICKMEVREAKNGDALKRGLILIAPGNLQTRVIAIGNSLTVSCRPDVKVNGHSPSVDVLFHSVASAAVCRDSIGVILTGMGTDGAEGLLSMRRNGAYTIGQNKSSCVVYGMPMAAQKIGAVTIEAPCANIGGMLLAKVGTRQRAVAK